MTPVLHLALRLVRRASSHARHEEIEGDLLELHARRRARRGLLYAERTVLWEALRSVVGRPSDTLLRQMRRLALVLTGGGVVIAYLMLVTGSVEPFMLGWPFVVLGTILELLFWYLLLFANRNDVEQRN